MQTLRHRIIESNHPVGIKRVNSWCLPPTAFSYGLPIKSDKEGVSKVTRSWRTHSGSKTMQPPQDFIRINKMAIKMNATTFDTSKDFRRHVDIKQIVRYGSRDRNIVLPPEDFAYGMRYKQPVLIKDLLYNAYGNEAEKVIDLEYRTFMKERKEMNRLAPKTTEHFNKLLKSKRDSKNVVEKPLYKMKMFMNTTSKVAEKIKEFKTYKTMRPKSGIDFLINKIEKQIEDEEAKENKENKAKENDKK